MTPLDTPWFDQPDSDPALTCADKLPLAVTPEPVPGAGAGAGADGGPAPLWALCEAALERHLVPLTAPLAGLTETELGRLRPAGPFDLLPPAISDRLTARLLRRRPTLAELPQLYCLTSPRQTAVRLAGKAIGCRARAAALRLRAPRLQLLVCDVTCDCDGLDSCEGYEEIVRLAVGSPQLRVFQDSSRHCLAGAALRRLLIQCPLLERLSVRLESPELIRSGLAGRAFPALRQLELSCDRPTGCWDVSALGRLFPGVQLLTLTGQPAAVDAEERCVCRSRAGPQLPWLETARLEHVCGTAAAVVRAAAPRLHTLRLLGCGLNPPEAGATRRPSLRSLVRTVLRRRLAALPSDQVRRLQICQDTVDAALINRHFPRLQTLAVQCSAMVGSPAAAGGPPLWFPCLERLSVHLTGGGGGGGSWEEPAILRRPVPRLTDYQQSFGCVSLCQLAVACPMLERLRLDPVLLAEQGTELESGTVPPLVALRQLTVGWCDSRSLAQLARLMPALRRVTVLDPPSLEERGWRHLEALLARRGVDVALQW